MKKYWLLCSFFGVFLIIGMCVAQDEKDDFDTYVKSVAPAAVAETITDGLIGAGIGELVCGPPCAALGAVAGGAYGAAKATFPSYNNTINNIENKWNK